MHKSPYTMVADAVAKSPYQSEFYGLCTFKGA